MTGRLCGALTMLLRALARLLPPGRRAWAEAVQAEAGLVPAGRARLGWLAGGVWLVAREARMIRRLLYGLGAAGVAAGLAWVVVLSWLPADDPEAMTDRFRILAGAAALVVLPWVGRRQGVFGPAARSLTARLVRVAGCAVVCGLGLTLLRTDRHHNINEVFGNGAVNWPRELGGWVAISLVIAVPALVLARRPQTDRSALALLTAAGAIVAVILAPLQMLVIVYVALVLAATAQRSPVRPATLGAGVFTGPLLLPAVYGIWRAWPSTNDDLFLFLLPVMATIALVTFPAGLAAAWRVRRTWSPAAEDGKDARGRSLRDVQVAQGALAGTISGAVGGMLISLAVSLILGELMVLGPLIGVAFGASGAVLWATHAPRLRPGRSWMAGLFVSRS